MDPLNPLRVARTFLVFITVGAILGCLAGVLFLFVGAMAIKVVYEDNRITTIFLYVGGAMGLVGGLGFALKFFLDWLSDARDDAAARANPSPYLEAR
jgi:hypothetical protein